MKEKHEAISPPTWGWPGRGTLPRLLGIDFPTHVGMARSSYGEDDFYQRFPHPRGDGPHGKSPNPTRRGISPPTWGWPGRARATARFLTDFPTHVGMARTSKSHTWSSSRFPHPRGDGPRSPTGCYPYRRISPPTWGWPELGIPTQIPRGDFPTHVGMARS